MPTYQHACVAFIGFIHERLSVLKKNHSFRVVFPFVWIQKLIDTIHIGANALISTEMCYFSCFS